jgi:hypothetical protein
MDVYLNEIPTGTRHRKRQPVDRAAIRRKHRQAFLLTRALFARLRRDIRNR